jgi:kumamolisin
LDTAIFQLLPDPTHNPKLKVTIGVSIDMPDIPSNYKRLEMSERKPALGARRVGPADPKEILSVSMRVRRRPDAPALPDMNEWATPVGARKFFSREEFAARYGARQDDLDRAAEFARDHGLALVESSIARRTVVVSGTVEQMSRAFAVELSRYESPTQQYRGRDGYVHLPADLVGIIEGVFGLDNRQMARPLFRRSVKPAQLTAPLTPPQVAKLYGFRPPAQNRSGQTIGLLEFGGGYQLSDIQTYFQQLGLSTPTLTSVGVDGATNAPGSDADTEVALDVDVAGAVAQGAKIAVYFAPWTEQGWVDVVTTAINDATNTPSVLSISWGWAEFETIDGLNWSQAAMNAVSTTFQDAAYMGVTVFAASGDDGTNCQIGDRKAHVLYPASDPWVTACGGTTVKDVSGSSFTEATWNDNGVTGGGISYAFALPFWQNGKGVPLSANGDGRQGRGIPDVAGNADPNSGYTLVLNGGPDGPIGGTSATAPLYAGLVALLNAALGEPVGYLNPYLYSFAGPLFRDIADGQSNATEGAPGYTSGPGWDACTGLGSVVGTELLYAVGAVTYRTFQGLDLQNVLVLGRDGNLWLEQAPFGTVPPSRRQVDGNVRAFQGLDAQHVLVLGTDGKLWLEQAPFGTVPPSRRQVDGNVAAFQGLDLQNVLVLGTDGKLWLEQAPFGTVPPSRRQVDGNVRAFQGLDAQHVLVLGTDGKLWLEQAPFGTVPPSRRQVDGNVA